MAKVVKKQPDKKQPGKKQTGKKQPGKKRAGKAMSASGPAAAVKRRKLGKGESGGASALTKGAAPESDAVVLDRLWSVVTERRGANPATSHSARLLSRGTMKIAQKFGEEAVECLIEAVGGNHEALVAESADVLYHLLVLWVDAGVRPDEVWAELQRREGVSGIAEKASRARKLPVRVGTTKIP